MCARVYACAHVNVGQCVCMLDVCVYACVGVCVRMRVCAYGRMCVRICIFAYYVHTRASVCECVRVNIRVHARTFVCVDVF